MKSLSEQLVETLSETRFDLEYTEVRGDGRWKRVTRRAMTASGLAEACRAEPAGIVNRRAYIHAPKTRMSQLVGELRTVLEPFIDPESDHLGLAFPIDGPRAGAVHRNGSKVQDFANSLVQAAAIIGVERTMQLLANWQAGEPIRFRTSTFVNGLILDGPLAPREDIEIVPLPLTTTELPRFVDSTASPIASQLAFNAWPGYVQAFIFVSGVGFLASETDRIAFFFQSVPFCFYAIFAVLGTLLLSVEKPVFLGPRLAAAMTRARTTGQLDAPGADPLSARELQASHVPAGYTPHVIEFFLSLGTLIAIAVGTFLA